MAYVFVRSNQRGPQNEQHIQTWYSWSQYMLSVEGELNITLWGRTLWVKLYYDLPIDLSEGSMMLSMMLCHFDGKYDSNAFIKHPLTYIVQVPSEVIQIIYFLMLHTVSSQRRILPRPARLGRSPWYQDLYCEETETSPLLLLDM